MINQQRVATLLGIRLEEVPKILIFIGTSIFIGMGIFFYYTGGNAIFLAEYQEDALPYVYIINAILVIAAGVFYSSISNVISLTTRVYGSSAVLATGTFLIWLSYFVTNSSLLAFSMMIWYRILFVFGMIDGWELIGATFNVHQAKRLFALSQLGVMIGMIIAAFVGAGLASVIGAVHLLLLSAITLFIYLGLQLRYVPRLRPFLTSEDETGVESVSIQMMLNNRYVVLLFGLKICMVITLTLTEYHFSQQTVENFAVEDKLASFLGASLGLAMVVNIFLVGLVSGRFISRFGVYVALLTLPIMIVTTAIISGAIVLSSGTNTTSFFITACSLMFIMWTMPYVVAIPAQNILLQPLPTRLRTAARVAIEGGLGSGALIVAGLLILLLKRLENDTSLIVLGLIMAIGVFWIGLATITFRNYAQQLIQAVSLRFMRGINTNIATKDDLLRGLSSSYADDIYASLALLGQSDAEALSPFYPELLRHPNPQIQRDILQRIVTDPQLSILGQVRTLALDPKTNEQVRADAIQAWAAIEPENALAQLVSMLPEVNEGLADSIIIAMARNTQYQAQALKTVQEMESLRAATILEKFPPHLSDEPLTVLLKHKDQPVIRRAILSVSPQHRMALQVCLSDLLTNSRYISVVVASLKTDGESLIPAVEAILISPTERHKTGAVRLLGAIGGQGAKMILAENLLGTNNWELRHQIISALGKLGYTTDQPTPILNLANVYQAALHEIIAFQAMANQSNGELLSRSLDYEFERGRADLLTLYSFIYPREAILGILYRLQLQNKKTVELGEILEVLELLMSRQDIQQLQPLLESLTPSERAKALGIASSDRPLTDIIYADETSWAGIWTRACAVRMLALTSPDSLSSAPIDSGSALLQTVIEEHFSRAYRPTWQYKISEFTEGKNEEEAMLSTLEKFAILRPLDLFEAVPDPILGELALVLQEQAFKAGQTLLQKGALGNTMYIVAEGKLIVHASENTADILTYRERGEVIGEFAVLDAEPRSAFVTADESGILLVIEQTTLYELMAVYPEIAQGIMKALVHKLRFAERKT